MSEPNGTELTPVQTMHVIRGQLETLTRRFKNQPELLDDPESPKGYGTRMALIEATNALECALKDSVRVQRVLWDAWHETHYPKETASYKQYLKDQNERACRPGSLLDKPDAATLSAIDQTP